MEKHEVIEIGSRITIPNFIYLIFSFVLSISGLFVFFPFYAFIALALLLYAFVRLIFPAVSPGSPSG